MPHQLYISTLPTFTYKEYVDGHRIQYVKPERDYKKNNIVEKLHTKSHNPWVYNKKWKAGTQLLIVYFKKRNNKKLKM